jgi:quercetin 2,3-dioxygenase
MDLRRVSRVITAHRQTEGGGFVVRRPFPSVVAGNEIDQLDPFLLLDEMGPTDYGPGEAIGAPDHPHRGFETVTYVLDGAVEHRDSTGAVGVIGPGAVQWMTAGSGIVHSEMPTGGIAELGGRMHGFQLWVNLRARDKMLAPRYQGFEADELSVVDTPGGTRLRVIAGAVAGVAGPVETTSPATFAHATVAARDAIEWDVAEGHTALVHVFAGTADVNGTTAHEGQLVELEHDGGRVVVGSENGAEILLLGGEPLREPIARYGPFVMNTRSEIVLAVEDFTEGRLGTIPADGSGVVRG